MKRIGVFGASFNPPTLGHQDVLNQCLDQFDEILLVPSLFHAFRKNLAPIEHRLAMLKIFSQRWQHENKCQVSIFNIEAKMAAANPSLNVIYTFDVLVEIEKFFQAENIPVSLRFIIGPDIASQEVWQKFYRYQEIEKRWPLFIAQEQVLIHSTMVKELLAQNPSDKLLEEKLITLVGKEIADYILEHQLYLPSKKERAYG